MTTAPLYVKSLFDLLRTLGVPQQEVARTLSVSKTTVSLWAHGREPLSPRYVGPLLDFVAKAATTPPTHQRTLTNIITDSKMVRQHLSLWAMERQQTLGTVGEHYRQGCDILAAYARHDPAKLAREQWGEINAACAAIRRTGRILTAWRQPSTIANGPLSPDMSREGIRAELQSIINQGHVQNLADIEDEENH